MWYFLGISPLHVVVNSVKAFRGARRDLKITYLFGTQTLDMLY